MRCRLSVGRAEVDRPTHPEILGGGWPSESWTLMLQHAPFSPSSTQDESLPFNNLDPFTAKQMAALQATSIAKAGNRSAPGGVTSASYFGGLSTHQMLPSHGHSALTTEPTGDYPQSLQLQGNPSSLSNMNPAPSQQQQFPQRKRAFLQRLGNLMVSRGTPLPPQLTGVPYPPTVDPSGSPWRTLDVSNSDIGVVRLASRDVDVFRLWLLVQQAGGGVKVNEQGMWPQLLPHFDLPEQFMQPNGKAQATAAALRHYYNAIIGPFEDLYRKDGPAREQQRALQQSRIPGGMPMPGVSQPRTNMPGMSGPIPPVGTLPAMGGNTSSGMMGQPTAGSALQPTDISLGGMQFSQGLAQSSQGPLMPVNSAPDSRALGSMDATGTEGISIPMATSGSSGSVSESEADGRKRKVEELEERNGKRARQKIGDNSDPRNVCQPGLTLYHLSSTDCSIKTVQSGSNGQISSMDTTARIRQPSRRKIIYTPYVREVDTAGGRSVDAIQQDLALASQKPLKDLSEWGTVDVEALTMSLRSRLSTELSYALTTFTVLALVRIKEGAFVLSQAPDLFEELLDLLEEVAFDGFEDSEEEGHPDTPIITHRALMNTLVEEGSSPFASLSPKQGLKEPSSGPQQRSADIILAITNIIRNLALAPENHDYLARHDRLLCIVLRLCSLKRPAANGLPTPLSAALSLNDLIIIRKDIVHLLVNIGPAVRLSSTPSSPSPLDMRRARRAYELLASYFIEATEAVAPYACILLTSLPTHLHGSKPPLMVDSALEVFTRVTHSDDNRMTLCKSIPQLWLWSTAEALVHRLPLDNSDFQVVGRGEWLAYLERVIMSLYSICFFAPPAVKNRLKTDRQLCFTKVFLRLMKKMSIHSSPDSRGNFSVALRRAVETLKLVDDAGDSFDTSSSTMPTLTFGMGYGEHGEARVEKGMGLLSGYQEEITWGLMVQDMDELVFSELVSLVRVEPNP
ncbi:hypothetical protein BC835DRAFT_1315745 [Cytidiella melzeri]|nr:hypothetical protein BC835DRAFT_1315745 [Cytidiella melzeri]